MCNVCNAVYVSCGKTKLTLQFPFFVFMNDGFSGWQCTECLWLHPDLLANLQCSPRPPYLNVEERGCGKREGRKKGWRRMEGMRAEDVLSVPFHKILDVPSKCTLDANRILDGLLVLWLTIHYKDNTTNRVTTSRKTRNVGIWQLLGKCHGFY